MPFPQATPSKKPIPGPTNNVYSSSYVPVATITNNPPNITYAGGRPIYQLSGGNVTYPSDATFSTISTLAINTSTINSGTISVSNNLNLDGNVLTSAGNELFLNGIALATTSNISSIGDWANYPAVSSINCLNNNILNVGNIVGKTGDMNLENVGTLTFDTAGLGAIVNLSTINGQPYNGGGGTVTNTITGTQTFDVADGGVSLTPTFATITAQNGAYGKVNITANPGIGGLSGGNISLTANGGSGISGLFGQIDLVANSGVADGVITGGKINITANSGSGLGLTSAVNLNAGGITVQSGYTSIVGSVPGYTFVGGNSGVNICGGLPSIIPNVPGTTFLYGTSGVEIGSDTFLTRVFPYQYGIINASDMLISGRELDIGLGNHIAYVNMEKCKSISFGGSTDPTLFGQIDRLSTINGQPYIPYPGGGGGSSISQAGGAVSVGTVGEITLNPAEGQTVSFGGGITITANDITGVGNITVQDGIILEGAGTISINGSTGVPGQVIGIPLGASYPEWTTATPAGGIYEIIGTEGTLITFDIPGMNENGILMPVYIQPSLVGGQWIQSVAPGVGNVSIKVGLDVVVGDSIIWSVISFGTAL